MEIWGDLFSLKIKREQSSQMHKQLSLLAWKKGQRVLLLTQLCDIAIADKGSIRVPPPLRKGQAED